MQLVRSTLLAVAVVALVGSGAAFAQTSPAPATPPASTTAKPEESWTKKKFEAAKAKWAAEKEKWADCNKQSKEQKLTGRKSWSFIASCMTK